MGYYQHQKEYDAKGIDYDLAACLEFNRQSEFDISEITNVLAVHEGENDEEDWHWVLQLTKRRFVYLRGGCDYTGWDCQSWASCVVATTPLKALNLGLNKGKLPLTDRNTPANAGLGHLLNPLGGTYTDKDQAVYQELNRQLATRKSKTWREKTDKDMPDLPVIDH